MVNNENSLEFVNDSDNFSLDPDALSFIPKGREFHRGPFPEWRRSNDPPLQAIILKDFKGINTACFPLSFPFPYPP